jgi:excisionase family DNA binding protein
MNATVIPIRSAAHRLGVHENTIRNWIERGIIRCRRLPSGVRRIPLDEVERLEREMFLVSGSFPEDKWVTPPASQADHETGGYRPQF